MNAVTAWTIIVCATLVCITAVTIVGLVVGNRKTFTPPKIEDQFALRDIPKPKARKLE